MVFNTTFNQMIFLFLMIAIGYILAKFKFVPEGTEQILSKLESYIFIPALVLGTFMSNFTVEKLSETKGLLLGSILLEALVITVSAVVVRLCTKDKYIQNVYLYGLCFSNFGFVGNALIKAIFPEIFLEYLLFTIILWTLIFTWGAPVLLMGNIGKKVTLKERLKTFLNPMFVALALGMVIGIANIPIPGFADSLVTTLGDCMSPVAMLLMGMTVARSKLRETLKFKSIYVITLIRLIIYPLIFVGVTKVLDMPHTFVICALASLAMPLGLNTIVIPGACGKDTKVATGMVLVSHVLACITIPIMFILV